MSNAIRQAKRGFTLIEALVAIVVVAIGVVGAMHGYQVVARTEIRAHNSESLQKLALDKYEEIVATAPTQLVATSGDLTDRGLSSYSYELAVDTTSITDLMALTVTVYSQSNPTAKGIVHGLYYQLPQSGTGTTQ